MSGPCFLVAGETVGDWARPGALFWRHHERDLERDTSPRPMPHLAFYSPAGLVCLDCPASPPDPPGSYWTRTGDPPNITVSPSINVSEDTWHGFIQNGTWTP